MEAERGLAGGWRLRGLSRAPAQSPCGRRPRKIKEAAGGIIDVRWPDRDEVQSLAATRHTCSGNLDGPPRVPVTSRRRTSASGESRRL
jgi:hypothetical protein